MSDEAAMELALAEADAAALHDDVPIGAVLIDPAGAIAGRGHNCREQLADPTAHAEILALRAAAKALGRWRLDDLTMVVTLEPCAMCAGALVNARIGRLVYGASDDKAGAVASLFVLGSDPRLHHRFPVTGGVLADRCAERMRRFFDHKRRRGDRDAPEFTES